MKEVTLYNKMENQRVQCLTCAHRCKISEGKRGVCGVRENQKGKLYSLVYGKAIAMHVDPIEKKPLFHFFPGSLSFSMATVGCNMKCLNCQNADISQLVRDHDQITGEHVSPEELVNRALKYRCHSISYTYTEPAVYWDYAYDTAKLATEKGIKNNFVTNGFLSFESLKKISPYLHAANVDLKGFREDTYRNVCGATLRPVLDTIQRMKKLKIWVEVTTLLIPGLNDSHDELKDIANFIYNIDSGIPWHISRFYPTYRMADRSATSIASLKQARQIGLDIGLKYVYIGNVPGDDGESTFCSECHTRVIHRIGFQVVSNRLDNGNCPECGRPINGIW